VTLPAVAQHAGCARTLVYRYFASREELLAAVLQDYVDRLDARIPATAQHDAVAASIAAALSDDQGTLKELIATFWEVQIAAGLGGAILRATPPQTPQIAALIAGSRRRFERRITDPLRAAGLSRTESQIAVDLMIASFVGLCARWRAGAISTDEAVDIHTRASIGVLRGLLAGRTTSSAITRRRAGGHGPRLRRR
jgi:AcrR family transcriptional regulator